MNIDDIEIKDVNEAFGFYEYCVLENGYVFNSDKKICDDEGVSQSEAMNDESGLHFDTLNAKCRSVLAESNIDAQEVIQYMESMLVMNLVTQTEQQPDGVRVSQINDIKAETAEQKKARRGSHLMTCVRNVVEVCEGANAITASSKIFAGVAISEESHPILQAYVHSMGERTNAEMHEVMAESIQEAEEYLREKMAGQVGAIDVDIDSDDNDDDPFSHLWGEEE
tara:strand:- start:2899 stop:3570 length:672 start_codon:yes stop_codon:yes gene_type:complete